MIPKNIINLRIHTLIVLVAGLIAYFACSINASYLDAFFYDLKSYMTSPAFPNEQFVEVGLSKLKKGDGSSIPAPDLAVFLDQIIASHPSQIVLAISTTEISGSTSEIESLAVKLGRIPNLLLYSRWGGKDSFADSEAFNKLPNLLTHKMTKDTKLNPYDEKIRRVVLSMNGKDWDSDLLSLLKVLKIDPPPLNDIEGTFQLFESKQLYLRYYDLESLKQYYIESDDINTSNLGGKIVFIGTRDQHSTLNSIHPFSRFSFRQNQSSQYFFPDSRYLLNLSGNLKTFDFIKEPSASVQWLWVFAIFYINIILAWRYSGHPKNYVYLSLSLLFVALAFSLGFFKFMRLNLDLTRVIFGSFLLQYLTFPALLLQTLRRADEFKLEAEKQRSQDRIRMQYLMRMAKADFGLKITAKVSHDIRGPLMALQVASKFINGMVPEELHKMIDDSTLRLKHIADETLDIYKGKVATGQEGQSDIQAVFEDLLKTYKSVYPRVNFTFEALRLTKSCVPALTLKRCLSNVLNNSVEALERCAEPHEVKMSAHIVNDDVILHIADNGPGIPKEIQSRLFQEQATFGKAGGTGLGLHQVKSELKVYGGDIELQDSEVGALFKIHLPRTPKKINYEVTDQVMIIEKENAIYSAVAGGNLEGIEISRKRTSADALRDLPLKNAWTVFLDLSLELEEEVDANFELLKKLEQYQNVKVVIFTPLESNPDVQKLADSYGALLIGRSRLGFMQFIKRASAGKQTL